MRKRANNKEQLQWGSDAPGFRKAVLAFAIQA